MLQRADVLRVSDVVRGSEAVNLGAVPSGGRLYHLVA